MIKKIVYGLIHILVFWGGQCCYSLTVHNETGANVRVSVYYQGVALPAVYELVAEKKLSNFTRKPYWPFIYVADTAFIKSTLSIYEAPGTPAIDVVLPEKKVSIQKFTVECPSGSGQIIGSQIIDGRDYAKDFSISVDKVIKEQVKR